MRDYGNGYKLANAEIEKGVHHYECIVWNYIHPSGLGCLWFVFSCKMGSFCLLSDDIKTGEKKHHQNLNPGIGCSSLSWIKFDWIRKKPCEGGLSVNQKQDVLEQLLLWMRGLDAEPAVLLLNEGSDLSLLTKKNKRVLIVSLWEIFINSTWQEQGDE